jgi:hypothetical protein
MSNENNPAIPTPRPVPARMHALVGELAQIAREGLAPLAERMFGSCDDVFFDLASRAKSNADQNRFFESLREVRLKKARFTAEFLTGVERGFSEIDQRAVPTAPKPRPKEMSVTDLDLVPHEQMEKEVLVTDMVSRARTVWQQELFQLHERLQVICAPFPDEQDPFDPGRITAAFAAAAENFAVGLDIHQIIYRQFERSVLRNLDDIYERANQRLIDAGVLPELSPLSKRKVKKYELPGEKKPAPAAAAPAQPDAGLAGVGIPDTDPEMRELAQVLKRLHDGGIRLPMLQSLPVAPPGPANPPLARDELVTLLSDMKPHPAPAGDGTAVAMDIRQAIEAIARSRGQVSFAQVDEDIINIVAMFFDIILDDPNLPIEIQALVGRLQLPILKVALKDRSFFSDRKHPARQLINEIARTSIGWDSSDKDEQEALFIRMTELVEQVLQGSSEHGDVFEKCLGDLMGFISNQDTRASKQEKRTRELAMAQARSAQAQEAVKEALNARLEGKTLPQVISDFLVNDWQQVLLQRHLKHDEHSVEWRDALQVVDDLVWAAQPHPDEQSLARLHSLLPDLRGRIAAALELAGTDIGRGGEALKQVTGALARLRAGQVSEQEARPLSDAQRRQITPVSPQKPWDEMTAVERQFVRQQELLNEQMNAIDAMEIGTWLQYDDLRQGVSRRCKLSARLAATDAFVFVNRMGAKVYEKPRKAFAYDLHMGYAKVLDDKPFFDRTLERITSNLRKLVET